MDKKMIISIAVVAVVVAAAAAVAITVMNPSDEEKPDYSELRLVVYGNANNDNYLDQKDVDFIQAIVDKDVTWDKKTHPFADANNDGKVDADDVKTVKGFLAGEKSIMYYRDWNGEASYVHFPVTGKISASYDVALDAAMISGWYDQVGYMNINASRIAAISTTLYPGVDKFVSTGNNGYDFDDVYSHDDLVLCCGDSYNFDDTFYSKMLGAHRNGGTKDFLKLPFARCVNGMDINTTIVTMGVMTMHQEHTKAYIDYMADIDNTIHSKLDGFENDLSYVIFYKVNGNDAFTLRVPNTTGFHHTNVYLVESLGFTSAAGKTSSGGVDCGIDDILSYDPDVIFIINTGWVNASLTDEQFTNNVKDMYKHLEHTRAYKNGNIWYFGYEVIGSAPGYATLPLLASFVWPDQFDEKEGWDILQNFYSTFLHRNTDIKETHLAPLKMEDLGLKASS